VNSDFRPYTLVAELTYRCPLRCPYCSNPLEWARLRDEIDTDTWRRVFREAEDLGVVQLNLSGGEPLLRDDLEALVVEARKLDLYTNLITSALPLTQARLSGLRAAGLDNVQISVQDVSAAASDRIAGTTSFARKLEAAKWVKALGMPLTLNIVLHRDNLDRVAAMITLAEELAVDRLELANTQYLGWALVNRQALLPTREQLERARAIAAAARARLRGRMEILFVTPDYFGEYPKTCMDGWGRRFLVVSPDGRALPCHAAHTLPGLEFDNVRDRPLAEIWTQSTGFNAYRGVAWMQEPCKSCARRDIDYGGCRCQAYHLTGDAAATDPVCKLAPTRKMIDAACATALSPQTVELQYRAPKVPAPG
jgi:pyrroloquinoline quinone biosynthesis protein E